MPPEFLNYDPISGVKREFDFEEDNGLIRIHSVQDVEPMLDRARELRNSGEADNGIKKSFWLYAELPPVVILEMKNKGIDIYSKDPTMIRRMFDEINANYKRFKTTYKSHR